MFFVSFIFYEVSLSEIHGYKKTEGTITCIESRRENGEKNAVSWLTYEYAVNGVKMTSACKGDYRNLGETYALYYDPQDPNIILDSRRLDTNYWVFVFSTVAMGGTWLLCLIDWYLDKPKNKTTSQKLAV